MASACGDGGIGEAESAAAATNRRRICDYLGEGEDGEVASPPSPETPPRLRLPRFTCARIRFGRLGRKRGGRKEGAAAAEKGEGTPVDSSGWNQGAGSRGGVGVAGGGVAAAAHTTGMGLSMLLLLARTCVELNRMAEVRAQMEALLKEMRDEAGRVKGAAGHDVVVGAPGTCHGPQSSSTTTASSSCVSDTSATTHCLEIVGRGEGDHRASPTEDEGYRAGTTEVVDAEADAEAGEETEPARRHQAPEYDCDTEQETPESSSDDDEFIELRGGRFGACGSSTAQSSPRGAADDDGSDGSCAWRRGEGGVSAAELERRLHELRHRRDRERIEALEAALRRAQRKLTEKEMEARLWQDTAALALGRPAPRDGGQ